MSEIRRREPVNWFSREMEKRLRANDHKTGWSGLQVPHILRRMSDEKEELQDALFNGQAHKAIKECADLANFCMMLADNLRRGLEAVSNKPEAPDA